jgi:hypothetical protein
LIEQAAVSSEDGVPVEAVSIENIVFAPGSKVGEGFACDIVAVEVSGPRTVL